MSNKHCSDKILSNETERQTKRLEKILASKRPHEIASAIEWLETRTEKSNKTDDYESAYGLKHVMEKDFNGIYVTEGSFIAAAKHLGYKLRRTYIPENFIHDSYVDIHICAKILTEEEAWKHVKPTGFSKWVFEKAIENDSPYCFDFGLDAPYDKDYPRTGKSLVEFIDFFKDKPVPEECVIEAFNEYQKTIPGPHPKAEEVAALESICHEFYDYNFSDNYTIINYNDDNFTFNLKKDETFLYVLFENDNSESFFDKIVKYVGQSRDPVRRLEQHILRPGSLNKVKWVGGLLNKNSFPKMGIICTCKSNISHELEIDLMHYFSEIERQHSVYGIDCNDKDFDIELKKQLDRPKYDFLLNTVGFSNNI